MKSGSLYLHPWVGNNYGQDKEKILLLGESHYDKYDNSSEKFTIEIINEVIEGARYKYFVNTNALFHKEGYSSIWQNVAFSNVIQTIYKNGKTQPDNKDKATIAPNFFSLLNLIQPTKLIVLSKRLWEWLPETNGYQVGIIKVGKRHSNLWEYTYSNGKCQAIGICHPSWMFGKNGTVKEWSRIIEDFIKF